MFMYKIIQYLLFGHIKISCEYSVFIHFTPSHQQSLGFPQLIPTSREKKAGEVSRGFKPSKFSIEICSRYKKIEKKARFSTAGKASTR